MEEAPNKSSIPKGPDFYVEEGEPHRLSQASFDLPKEKAELGDEDYCK